MAGNPPEDRSGDSSRKAEDAPKGLNEDQIKHLRFESQTWPTEGHKAQAIRDEFGVSDTRYYQKLNYLVDNPAAYEHNNYEFAPMLNRLARLREMRQNARRANPRKL